MSAYKAPSAFTKRQYKLIENTLKRYIDEELKARFQAVIKELSRTETGRLASQIASFEAVLREISLRSRSRSPFDFCDEPHRGELPAVPAVLTVSVEQAATMFGCSAETVRRQIRRGELPKIEGIGRHVRLSKELVLRAIAGEKIADIVADMETR